LGEALAAGGEFEHAEIVLAEALDDALYLGNRGLECRVLLARLKLQMWTNSLGSLDHAMGELARIVSIFEDLGDSAGLARAWLFACELRFLNGSAAEAQRAAERATDHARRVSDATAEDWGLGWLAVAMSTGPAPAEQGLATCREILAGTPSRIVAGGAYQTLARLSAYRGHFDEARAHGATTVRIFEDWGHRVFAASSAQVTGDIEVLAGDLVSAEKVYRAGFEALEEIGEKGYLSTLAGQLAHVLCTQGHLEEAERFAVICEETTVPDDVMSQVLWHSARARILARMGTVDGAKRLATEAIAVADRSDFTNHRADARMSLAEVLVQIGETQQAVAQIRGAIELYEQKGNIVSANAARAQLADLEAPTKANR
jgi:hypothetical protein